MRHYKLVGIGGLAVAALALAVLAWQPHSSLTMVVVLSSIAGMGIGTVYPLATVSVQNAVPMHQVGTATGTMNFFRALISALVVAVMGAIVLAGLGATPERGTGVSNLGVALGASATDFALIFRWVFAAAAAFLAVGALSLVVMEGRPLRGPVTTANPPPSGPSSV